MTNTKDTMNEELKQFHCSIIMAEVREKVQMLREYGMSDAEIESHLRGTQSFPKLIISKEYQIFLGDERKEVHMEPLVKAVYLLFLKHPEGIMFKCLPDYREELAQIYAKLKPYGMSDRVLQSIEDVTNPLLNSINEKCARIRKLFASLLPPNAARYYTISGKRGEPKKIDLVRANVIWKCKLPDSQGL